MTMNRLAVVPKVINFVFLIVVLAQSRLIANQTIPQVLRVRALQLVDKNGEVRSQLNVGETNGEVVFRLLDAKGTIRVKMGASEEGSGLLLLNNLTEPGVHILANQDGTTLTLVDHNGVKRVIEP
ncbi:MAG TPA: hypothetical protein VI753_08340 [Anaerolineales bacterium]|nr:hypothetical protein [Anaerolineales bacterium]